MSGPEVSSQIAGERFPGCKDLYFRCIRKARAPISAPAGTNPRARPAARPYAPGPVSGDASLLPVGTERSNFGTLGAENFGSDRLGRDTPPLPPTFALAAFEASWAAFSSASAAFRDAWIAASSASTADRCCAAVSGAGAGTGGAGGAALAAGAFVALGFLGFGASLGAFAASSAATAACASLRLAYVFMVVTLLRGDTAGRTVARMPGAIVDTAVRQVTRMSERIDLIKNEISGGEYSVNLANNFKD